MKIQLIHNSEQYTDKGDFATMTRTTVLKLDSIAGHLCRNAEELVSLTVHPPSTTVELPERCWGGRIALRHCASEQGSTTNKMFS